MYISFFYVYFPSWHNFFSFMRFIFETSETTRFTHCLAKLRNSARAKLRLNESPKLVCELGLARWRRKLRPELRRTWRDEAKLWARQKGLPLANRDRGTRCERVRNHLAISGDAEAGKYHEIWGLFRGIRGRKSIWWTIDNGQVSEVVKYYEELGSLKDMPEEESIG